MEISNRGLVVIWSLVIISLPFAIPYWIAQWFVGLGKKEEPVKKKKKRPKGRMKILFINAVDTTKEIELHYPPLGLAYLVSALRERFGDKIECKIINDYVVMHLWNFQPDIVGISCVSKNYNIAKRHANTVKLQDSPVKAGRKSRYIPVIIGGYHITALPETMTEDMDIAVIGEGEVTMCELIESYMKTVKFDKVDGIAYWDKGKVKKTKPRELIKDLDTLLLPARDLFKMTGDAYMFSSRGCPFNCVFCASTRFWKGMRQFSAEYIANEILHLVQEYDVKHIHFYDDIFTVDKKRIKKIINLLRMCDLLGKVTFSGQARAGTIDDELGQLLKQMGFKGMGIGLESGCDKTLKFLKGNVTVAQNSDSVNILKKYIRSVHGAFIIGSPLETEDDILETLRFIKDSKLDSIRTNILTPLPGTPLWHHALERGLVSNNMDWSRLDFDFNKAVILSKGLRKGDLKGLHDRFEKQGKWMRRKYLIKNGLMHPWEILSYLKFRRRAK